MKHLSEEELTGQAYGEGGASAEKHLEACVDCSEAFAALRRDLAELEVVEPPARDDTYGELVWETIRGSLPKYEPRWGSWWRAGLVRGLSYAAVCTALVAGAFYAGRQWEQRHRQAPAIAANAGTSNAPVKQPILVVVLSDHLDRSERLLVELKHADPGSEEMVSPLRDEARSLLAANRVCRKDASQVDDPALKTALERLDHVLTDLADGPGGLNTATITRLQDEMKADGLLFQVRVLRTRIPNRQAGAKIRTNGGTV